MPWPQWLARQRIPLLQRAVSYLLRDQTDDGAWYGRWGVNYVYGTSGVLRALETVALTARDYCQRAVTWLRAVQNDDGGFGESIASYYDAKLKGRGASTASQTAWGLIGLLAASDRERSALSAAPWRTWSNSRTPTGLGTRSSLPAQDSRACST